MNLTELKKLYDELKKKNNLPNFDELNLNFDIGKIRRDSGYIIRDIRRIMVEKIVYYLKLVELMINPANASPIFLMLLKEINVNDRKTIDSILHSFVELELNSHKLDIDFSEKNEATLINKINTLWNGKKKELDTLIGILERNWKQVNVSNNAPKKSRDYFN